MNLDNLHTTSTYSRNTVSSRRLPEVRLPRIPAALIVPLLIAVAILIPIGILATEILSPSLDLWRHMLDTFLPRVIRNTLMLVVGVSAGTLVIGTGFAWLVAAYDFPGRRWFEHLLLLPLAIPTFVMGFIFMATFDFAGPVQTQLRAWFGDDIWFPDIRSGLGVIIVMTLVLYPYVYILARAAFREQAASTFEAAQVMGYSRWQTFRKLVLPLARPSIAAGTILAMMEALTDYGAVQFFSFPTLSERVVVLWNRSYDYGEATQLAALLLFFALGIIFLERTLRGKARYYQQGGSRGRRMPRLRLTGWRKWGATSLCMGLLSAAFFLPALQLIVWAIDEIQTPSVGSWQAVYGEYISNSVILAGSAASVVVVLALLVVYGVRFSGGGRLPNLLTRFLTLGYAMPGAVIAIGVLTFVNPIDGAVTDFAESLGRMDRSYLLTGTIIALTYAYVVRFMAVGFSSVDSSMDKIKPTMEQAARTCGAKSGRIMRRIHLPLVSTGMAAGAILVFVDVMKELPATLLLRPFGMDTLGLWAYFLAMESFWEAAAIPSLTIVAVGLVPVIILMRVGDK